jgi:16S rRNA (cytosine1402-N4)-methyltransferase
VNDAPADCHDRHVPVLREEVLEHLAPVAGERMLDCTLGYGGHSESLLERGVEVFGIDRDPAARALAAQRLERFGDALVLHDGTYAGVAEGLLERSEHFDGVLADLGVSSMQLDEPERGFSIRSDHDLDLRMGDGCKETALDLLDRLSENDLADLLWYYGEERRSRQVAPALKRAREDGMRTGREMAAVIRAAIGGSQRRHPALRSFQALRIAINDEVGQLERLLAAIPGLLRPGGRAVIITFHSLEDRLVKRAFKAHAHAGTLAQVSKKVVTATKSELAANRRSAPAKLRWAVAPHEATAPAEAQAEPDEGLGDG